MTNRGWSLVVLAMLAGCSGKQVVQRAPCDGPSWTCTKSGPCDFAETPELKGSLCAVGIADQISSYNLGMQTATTRARTEMGAVIKTQVDGFTRATQDSLSKGDGEDSVQKVSDMAQQLVDTAMSGVVIPRTWYDKETKTFFALAAVDSKTFVSALQGLKDAKGLSEATRQEIEKRAVGVVDEWERERDRRDRGR